MDRATPAPAPAPEWQVGQWFNSDRSLTLADFRGRVIALHAFQMLCPGCVQHGLPQAARIAQMFDRSQVAVIGLHTVFEHHEAMTPVALAAFIHEYRLTFPIGVDMPRETGPIPRTMAAYAMQGTPSLILIDRHGRLRKQTLGTEDDMRVGSDIAFLLTERERPDDPGYDDPIKREQSAETGRSAAERCRMEDRGPRSE